MTTKITFQAPRVGSIIEYNYIYSNEETVIGLVVKEEEDTNFYKILHCLTNKKEMDFIPLSTIDFKIIKY